MIRMLLGIRSRINETPALENAVTKITAIAMVSDVDNLVVTANAEQIPRICSAIGLFLKTGSKIRLAAEACLAIGAPFLWFDRGLG